MTALITSWTTWRPARNESHATRQQALDKARIEQAAESFIQATRGI